MRTILSIHVVCSLPVSLPISLLIPFFNFGTASIHEEQVSFRVALQPALCRGQCPIFDSDICRIAISNRNGNGFPSYACRDVERYAVSRSWVETDAVTGVCCYYYSWTHICDNLLFPQSLLLCLSFIVCATYVMSWHKTTCLEIVFRIRN